MYCSKLKVEQVRGRIPHNNFSWVSAFGGIDRERELRRGQSSVKSLQNTNSILHTNSTDEDEFEDSNLT